ncbi:probable cytochrome P450 313a4 [Ochlerotatus camptorhynchus]|uniref:probable cytochrome P450 313a4 n=1 Tax=Ochlerotatus camptorhynchus TaxID=644619 RepID=UPI0031E0147A
MWSLILTVIISSLGAVLYWIHRRARFRFADKWPCLQPVYPLIGNAPIVFGKSDVERFEVIRDVCIASDRIMKAWVGPKLLLVTSHPDFIQQILGSAHCLEKPFLYRFAGFEQGLFTAKYHIWKEARKRLNPTFNQRIIRGFVPIFAKCADKMVARLSEYSDGETVNIHKYTALCTLEMACGTTLGSDVLQREGKEEFEQGLDQAFNGAARRMMSVHLYTDVVFRMTRHYKELMHARKVVCDFFTKLVIERKQYLSEKCNSNEPKQEDSHKPKILVDQLLSTSQDGKTFTQEQITDNVYAVITGAVDTTGLVTAHACLFLSFYPEVQDRLYAEINQHFPTGPSEEVEFSPDILKQLTYMEMFLNEVQRHWTVVPAIARENIAEIEIDGVKVPPGNIFCLSFYALHRRQDIWGPDADRFDPENFSEERVKKRHPFAFVPFSGGNRICLGWRYASFSMKTVMVSLVRNFKFSTKIKQEDIRFKHDLTLKLPFEHWVQISKRKPTTA